MSLWLLVALAPAVLADTTTVTLDNGLVVGEQTPTYRAFRGIPYAAPPLGDLRWRPPQPAMPWKPATLSALQFRDSCAQAPGFDPPVGSTSEDCLYLNVYAPPANKTTQPLPVFFWVHGGGYTGGGGNESRLNGTWDVTLLENTIFVTHNYRLNIFGFLGGNVFRSRDPQGSTGNYGLQDQRLALQWVQQNIAAFGGDPNRVFLVGESAGAGSVSVHLASPASWGLFHRAGMESGAFSTWISQTLVNAQKTLDVVSNKTGCGNAPDLVACLLALSTQELVQYASMVYAPTIDGIELTDEPWRLAQAGHVSKVPVLCGSNGEDAAGLNLPSDKANKDDFKKWTTDTFGHEAGDAIHLLYNPLRPNMSEPISPYYWAAVHVVADVAMTCPARRTARWFSGGGSFLYWFTHVKVSAQPWQGAYHSSEIPFVFHVLQTAEWSMMLANAGEVALSTTMVNYWTNFAATGNPNAPGLPNWPQYKNATNLALQLDIPTIAPVADLKTVRCDFWDAALPHMPTLSHRR